MKTNVKRMQRVMVWLGVACVGLLPLGPLSAQEPKLRATFDGHTDIVNSVAFSPDGKTLASGGSPDPTIKLWDVATGKVQATLKGHTGESNTVWSVAFSPDGKTLASGGGDETVKLWDVATGKERATLKGHTNGVHSVAFSPDGKTLASGSGDETIKLWNVATGKEKATLTGQYTGAVHSVAFSPDGKTLAAGSHYMTIKLWDVATGKEQADLKGSAVRDGAQRAHTEAVQSVAYSPDGKTLASGSRDHTIRLWDVATGKERAALGHGATVYCVAFSPDGKTLASGSGFANGRIKLWDVATGKEKATLKGPTNLVHSVAYSPDGKTLASGQSANSNDNGKTNDKTIRLWDVPAAKKADEFGAFIQKVAGDKITFFKAANTTAPPVLTLTASKDVKVFHLKVTGTGKEAIGERGEEVKDGLKDKIFSNIRNPGILVTLVTDKEGKVTEVKLWPRKPRPVKPKESKEGDK